MGIGCLAHGPPETPTLGPAHAAGRAAKVFASSQDGCPRAWAEPGPERPTSGQPWATQLSSPARRYSAVAKSRSEPLSQHCSGTRIELPLKPHLTALLVHSCGTGAGTGTGTRAWHPPPHAGAP